VIAAFIPISVNLAVTSFLRAEGKLANPFTLGLGASIGLFTGFAALFAMIHLRRQTAKVEASLVEAG
jgi:hypothetical protein